MRDVRADGTARTSRPCKHATGKARNPAEFPPHEFCGVRALVDPIALSGYKPAWTQPARAAPVIVWQLPPVAAEHVWQMAQSVSTVAVAQVWWRHSPGALLELQLQPAGHALVGSQ